jgi:hypothetical protein
LYCHYIQYNDRGNKTFKQGELWNLSTAEVDSLYLGLFNL